MRPKTYTLEKAMERLGKYWDIDSILDEVKKRKLKLYIRRVEWKYNTPDRKDEISQYLAKETFKGIAKEYEINNYNADVIRKYRDKKQFKLPPPILIEGNEKQIGNRVLCAIRDHLISLYIGLYSDSLSKREPSGDMPTWYLPLNQENKKAEEFNKIIMDLDEYGHCDYIPGWFLPSPDKKDFNLKYSINPYVNGRLSGDFYYDWSDPITFKDIYFYENDLLELKNPTSSKEKIKQLESQTIDQQNEISQLKIKIEELNEKCFDLRDAHKYKSAGLDAVYEVIEKYFLDDEKNPIYFDKYNDLPNIKEMMQYFKDNWNHAPGETAVRGILKTIYDLNPKERTK